MEDYVQHSTDMVHITMITGQATLEKPELPFLEKPYWPESVHCSLISELFSSNAECKIDITLHTLISAVHNPSAIEFCISWCTEQYI